MKRKKILYITCYMICIIIICTLNMLSVTDVLSKRLSLKLVDNPLVFLLLDGIILFVIFKLLKKEPYRLQQRIITYFKTTNNIFLLFAFIYSCSYMPIVINLIGNIILVYLLRPLSANPSEVNGVEEYFNKYPEKNHHKFYNNIEEIKEDYKPLKKEVEVEIPALGVEIKDVKKEKDKKFISTTIPIIIFTLLAFGLFFSVVEILKSFERAQYNYFEVTINGENINIYYQETYHRTIIPFVYRQKEERFFYTSDSSHDYLNKISKEDLYEIELTEYECINNEKDKGIKVSCDGNSLNEQKKEISLTKNKMIITHSNETIYDGEYIKDISLYLTETGNYRFEISNKRDYITTKINFEICITEETIEN